MPNTYTQIHIHCVFATKFRLALITNDWKEQLHKYITGIIQNHQHKMIAINSMPDHLHLFFGMRPHQALSDLIRIVKSDSSEWINKQKFTKSKFQWQAGFGAFSYHINKISVIADYIENQESHHIKKSFSKEYISLLNEFEIKYDQKYVFNNPE